SNQTYTLRVFQKQTEMFHDQDFFDIWASSTLNILDFELQTNTLRMTGRSTLSISNLNAPAKLELYNMLGQKVLSQNIEPSYEQRIELNMANGVYIAKLVTPNIIRSLK